MEIRIITEGDHVDIANEPFTLFGRMIPMFDGECWHCREELWEETRETCFPEEDYDPSAGEQTFIGAFEGERCVGLAVLNDCWYKYMDLNDLKVCRDRRGQGIGAALVEKSLEVALQKGYRGIYAVGQANNLAACRFYLKNGFTIGGFNDHVYDGTSLEGDADIYFYRKAK